jgi:thiol reductant ABC exporter CydC subunit
VRRVLALAWPLRGRVLVAAAAGALATGCAIALLATSGFLLARASEHPSIAALSVAVVAVRALSVGRGLFRYGERLASHDVAFRVLARARVGIWRRLESLAPAGLPAFHSGDLLARLVADVDATQDLFIRGLTPVLAAVLAGSGAVVACVALIGRGGLVLAAGLLAGAVAVPLACVTAARKAARGVAPARGRLSAEVTELLAGAADLTAFGAADAALRRARESSRELTRLARRAGMAAGLSSGLSLLVAGVTVWGVLLLGVDAVGGGAISRVPLAAATLTALAAFEAVNTLPTAAVALNQARTSAGRITSVLDAPAPVTDPAEPLPLPVPAGPVAVSLRDARVRYEAGGPLALDGVSLDLAPGRRVALVGPNGAGKSTVAAVLLRFLELDGGLATMAPAGCAGGARSLADYLADDVRTVIGGCPADPHLFNATIAENLRLACPGATQADLLAVIDRVGLAGWVDSLPDGLRTRVGENGATTSGGQRQRIALGRALLADPRVLVLDEPAAHLDAEARSWLIADILAVTSGRSALLITHDLLWLDQVDEIVVLDRGRVVERGTHDELLALDGLYRRMFSAARDLQACQAEPDLVR